MHLRRLLMDVVTRSMEMDKLHEALPWLQELQALNPSIGAHKFSHFDRWIEGVNRGAVEKSRNPLLRRSGMSQDDEEGFRKQTTYWMNPNTDASRPKNRFAYSAPVASSSGTLRIDEGKGEALGPLLDVRSYAAQDTKGKPKEVNPMFELSIIHSLADEEIFSPGAAAQRKLDCLRNTSPLQSDIFGGAGSDDHLNCWSDMSTNNHGGRTLGGLGTSGSGMGGLGIGGGTDNLGSNDHLDSARSLRDMSSLSVASTASPRVYQETFFGSEMDARRG